VVPGKLMGAPDSGVALAMLSLAGAGIVSKKRVKLPSSEPPPEGSVPSIAMK